ncbi:MAG: sensor domain-containing diguanylate cyclase [Nitrospirae bacterium]|nr:MAG: sensor domain-containing diguanylate cyclase [Nitrospirota bacterium]
MAEIKADEWFFGYKKKLIIGILVALTLSITFAMIVLAFLLRDRLIEDTKIKTRELSQIIKMSLGHLMLARDPEKIQSSLENFRNHESSIIRTIVLDRYGKIAYSTDKTERGRIIDRFKDSSCLSCHRNNVGTHKVTTTLLDINGSKVLRSVNVIYNEPSCHGCHDPAERINGKLIIDRSLAPTYSLIFTLELIIAVSGLVCLVFLVPFLSRFLAKGLDRYIDEIIVKSKELSFLYNVVERLSRTIEISDLKHTVVDIIRDALDADEIDIVLPKEYRDAGAIAWTGYENRMFRKKIEPSDHIFEVTNKWLKEDITEEWFSKDRKEVYIPINKGDNRLALIVVRKTFRDFDRVRLALIKILSTHLSVAFENAMLYHIAITDELTGLYSKRHFRTSIEKRFIMYETYGEKLTLLMLDIDNFKKVNDTYGHPAGDQVLKEASNCVQLAIRDDDMAFRYGGEELVVILPATDEESGKVVAERIRESIESQEVDTGEARIKVTVSIGVASCPQNALSIKDIINEADKALYEAKRTGKNRVVLSSLEAKY